MGVLNAFTATVWATPIVITVLMSQRLRRKMRPTGRVALWLVYFVWGWGWVSLWDSMTSGGSGRFAVENLIFTWGVWGTTGLGAVLLGWAGLVRRRGASEG